MTLSKNYDAEKDQTDILTLIARPPRRDYLKETQLYTPMVEWTGLPSSCAINPATGQWFCSLSLITAEKPSLMLIS